MIERQCSKETSIELEKEVHVPCYSSSIRFYHFWLKAQDKQMKFQKIEVIDIINISWENEFSLVF